MSSQNSVPRMTVDEYLAMEEKSQVKHEYVDGDTFAMSGVSRNHNNISVNLAVLLRAHVKGSGCSAYIAEVKLRVEANNAFYYPDVMVSCGKNEPQEYVETPVLVAEVLSRSTSLVDRREKLLAYKRIPSVREYLLIQQTSKSVTLHRRTEDNSWQTFVFADTGTIRLESMPVGPLEFPLEAIYEDVDWQADSVVREAEGEYEYSINV